MALPIEDVLGEVCAAAASGTAVLVAPPGAGKTTRVPLALMEAGLGPVVMLEPRRLAARAAAARMADSLGEPVGKTVGYAVRGERKVSAAMRIEVVTEGILVRRIQRDPELAGVGCVVLDEFHERSLDADLALALCLEARELRGDLRVLVMSATLAAEPVAALMGGAPVVRSEGRMYPVETEWMDRPSGRVAEDVAALVPRALEHGATLAFLPGAGEIGRCAQALSGLGVPIQRLFGAMPLAEQKAVVAPHEGPRVVLATSIAETSLTVPGIRAVVDGGLARRARHDPGSGMSRLVTERASKAEADQRRGRAGREGPGLCLRAWTRGQEGAMPAFAPPEMLTADLAGLALQLADWGAPLPFLDAPPEGAMEEARTLLTALGALDGGITPHGREMARLPLHPRLAHMLLTAGRGAADLAALLSEGDPLRTLGVDASLRLRRIKAPEMGRVRSEAARLRRMAPEGGPVDDGAAASLAYPDRIGLRRPGDAPRWLLSGGKGAAMDADASLAGQRMIVALDTDGGREARVRLALSVAESEIRALHEVRTVHVAEWSRRERRVIAVEREMLGALVLSEARWDAPEEALAEAALEGMLDLGLRWRGRAGRLLARARLAGLDAADRLEEEADDWLLPHLGGLRTEADLKGFDLAPALEARIGWEGIERIRREVPEHFVTPLGRRVPIDYDAETPTAEMQVKELYGVTTHPRAGGQPLRLSLLSPGGKPVAVTSDLPGFWDGAWGEVRKEMRGRYPKHDWPEDPRAAAPTVRAKRRG